MNKKPLIYIVDDKLIDLIVNRWMLSPLIIGVFASIIPLSFFGILAFILGELKSHDDTIGYLEDFTLFANFIFGFSPVATFYFLLPIYIQQCFEKLIANKVFTYSKSTENSSAKYNGFDDFLKVVKESLSSRLWIGIGFLISTIFMAIIIPEHLKAKHWITKHSLSFISMESTWWILFSFTIILILRILAGIWWINQAFKNFYVVVRPLYPDKVGGLQPLSQFSIRLGYLIFFIGLELGLNQYFTGYKTSGVLGQIAWTFDILLVWGVYIVLAPLVFFAPISAAHDAMLNAKNNEILLISSHFEKEYQLLRNNLGKSVVNLRKHSHKIEELQKLYVVADNFPVWPFQVQKFAQFFATILSPLILTIISSVITSWLVGL